MPGESRLTLGLRDDGAGLDVGLGPKKDWAVRVRAGAKDDRFVPERDHEECAEQIGLGVAARLHLRFDLAARADVESEQVQGRAGAGMVICLENTPDDQLHDSLSLPAAGVFQTALRSSLVRVVLHGGGYVVVILGYLTCMEPAMAFLVSPQERPAIEVCVNFGVFAGRDATSAELDRLAAWLLDEVGEVSIISEQRFETDGNVEASVHRVRIEVADGVGDRDALAARIVERAEYWAHLCVADRHAAIVT